MGRNLFAVIQMYFPFSCGLQCFWGLIHYLWYCEITLFSCYSVYEVNCCLIYIFLFYIDIEAPESLNILYFLIAIPVFLYKYVKVSDWYVCWKCCRSFSRFYNFSMTISCSMCIYKYAVQKALSWVCASIIIFLLHYCWHKSAYI